MAAVTLSACQWTSPVVTMKSYDPADGVSTQIGSLHLNNVLVISNSKGGPGNVVGLAVNGAAAPAQISVSTLEAGQSGGTGAQISVPANGTAQLTPAQDKALALPSVDVPPGAAVQLLIRTGGGQAVLDVPVLPAEGVYAKLGPAGAPKPTAAAPTTAPAPESTAGH